jgi:flagella basal body P-ring formation protein FlgA
MVQLGARFTIFGSFVAALGWVILFGISKDLSAAPTSAVDRATAAEMAARSTVNSFLQTAQLNQFDRARDFLAAKTRKTVSATDLKSMFANLPLNQAPASVTSALEQEGRVAKVIVVRNGAAEVYTLVQEAQGWGLASVAVRRS